MRLTTLSLCGLICIAAPGAALAQATPTQATPPQPGPAQARPSLTVAGLRAPDGDNDLASSLSDALREAARGRGFEVPANTPALDQEFAMLGCSTTTPDCLSPIADDLHAPRFIYGSVLRVGRGRDAQLTVEVTLWDDTTHRASTPASVTVTRAQLSTSPDALRIVARQLLEETLRGSPGAAPAPDPEAERRRQEEARAQELSSRVLRPTTPAPRSRTRLWIGVGMLGAGALLGGLAAWQWAVTSGYSSDSTNATGEHGLQWARYDTMVSRPVNGSYPLTVDDVCARAATDAASNPNAAGAHQLCEATSTSKTLAWVFGLTGVALAGVGATLVVLDMRSGSGASREGDTQPRQARLQLTPTFGPTVNGMDLRLTF